MKHNSDAFTSLVRSLQRCSQIDAHILISGEMGTGKRQSAVSIHNASARSNARFISLNCAGLTDEQFKIEMFGKNNDVHEFVRKGMLFMAEGGTVYLHEVNELSLPNQALLLRFLETGIYMPVNSVDVISADVRFICSSSKNISGLVENGLFRNDLYHLISQMVITTPTINDRIDDMEMLSKNIISELFPNQRFVLDELALAYLKGHSFTGNLIELKNILVRALSLAKSNIISGPIIQHAIQSGLLYQKEADILSPVESLEQSFPNISLKDTLSELPDKDLLNPRNEMFMDTFDRRSVKRNSLNTPDIDQEIIRNRFSNTHMTAPTSSDITNDQAISPDSIYGEQVNMDLKNPKNNNVTDEKKAFSPKAHELLYIKELMDKFNGDKARVAKELGCTTRTLYRKITKMKDLKII